MWKNKKIDANKLISKTISHALRHAPWEYELELDAEGWVNISDLIDALKKERREWETLTAEKIIEINQDASKQRFEITSEKIRALYGHSIPTKLEKKIAKPPAFLYHGTSKEALDHILTHGLKPMRRQYVHLSIDTSMAILVGSRKSKTPIILEIDSEKAFSECVLFYIGNDHVWLADHISGKYIKILK